MDVGDDYGIEDYGIEIPMEMDDQVPTTAIRYLNNGKCLSRNDSNLTDVYDNIVWMNIGFGLEKDGKYAVCDQNGKIKTRFIYDRFERLSGSDDIDVFIKGNNRGLIGSNFKELVPAAYQKFIFHDKTHNITLVDDQNGDERVLFNFKLYPKKLEQVTFYDGGVICRTNSGYGYVKSGVEVIPFQFDSIMMSLNKKNRYNNYYARNYRQMFHGTVLFLLKDGKYGVSRTNGETLLPVSYNKLWTDGNNNLVFIEEEKKFGYYATETGELYKPELDKIVKVGSTVVVYKGEKVGLLNGSGDQLFPIEYDGIIPESYRGYIQLVKSGKVGLANYDGEIKVPVIYATIQQLSGDRRTPLDERIFTVSLNGKHGLIQGEDQLLAFEYEEISYFKDSLFRLKQDEKFGLWSFSGSVLDCEYDKISNFNKKIILLEKDSKYGLFGIEGKEILSVDYDEISYTGSILKDNYLSEKKSSALWIRKGELIGYCINYDSVVEPKYTKVSRIKNSNNEYTVYSYNNSPIYWEGVLPTNKVEVFNELGGEVNIDENVVEVRQLVKGKDDIGLAILKKDGKWGIQSTNGEILVPFDYKDLYFSQDIAALYWNDGIRNDSLGNSDLRVVASKNGKKYGVLNLKAEVLCPFDYLAIEGLSRDGMTKLLTKKGWLLADINFKINNEVPFDEIGQFEEDLAPTFIGNEMRKINKEGILLSESIEAEPHIGYKNFEEYKIALYNALTDTSSTEPLLRFCEAVSPSAHLQEYIKVNPVTGKEIGHIEKDQIVQSYYRRLSEFRMKYILTLRGEAHKYRFSQSRYAEDYTEEKLKQILLDDTFYMFYNDKFWTVRSTSNSPVNDDLLSFIYHPIQVNGYWISSSFLRYRY